MIIGFINFDAGIVAETRVSLRPYCKGTKLALAMGFICFALLAAVLFSRDFLPLLDAFVMDVMILILIS